MAASKYIDGVETGAEGVEMDSFVSGPFDRKTTSKDGIAVTLKDFIAANFHQHDACMMFCPADSDGVKCGCGRTREDHETVAINPSGEAWDRKKHATRDKASTFGTVKFSKQTTNWLPRSAPYLRVSTDDDEHDVVHVVREILKKRHDKYRAPSLIISITGGARDFDLSPRLLSAIKKGLLTAALSTDAWIITGGSNSGVMQLVGNILSDAAADKQIPVIGIITWGIVQHREKLCEPTLEARTGIDYNFPDYSYQALDRNHNLFLMVDDGRVNQFGGEIDFRTRFEKCISETEGAYADTTNFTTSQKRRHEDQVRENRIPIITVVVQGGPGTLQTAHDAVKNGTPLVVVQGTGKAADVLAYAWEFLHADTPVARTYSSSGLRQLILAELTSDTDKAEQFLQTVLECVQDASKVVVYDINMQGSANIDEAILQAVFQGGSSVSLKFKLKQAMLWNRLDMAKKALQSAGASKEEQREMEEILNFNLMWALKHNSPDFVELYLEHGANAWSLRPTQATESVKKTQFELAIEELYEGAHRDRNGHVRYLLNKRRNHTQWHLDNVHRTLERLVSPDFEFKYQFDLMRKTTEDILKDPNHTELIRERETLAYHVLLMWAVCLDKYRLAHMFWLRGDESVPNALVASRILDAMSRDPALQIVHLADDREKMIKNSAKFEVLAVGVLEQCQKADADQVVMMLHAPIPRFKDKNCIEVAYDAKNLSFISNQATQAVINADWFHSPPRKNGRNVGMETGTNFIKIILCILFPPFILFFLKFESRQLPGASSDIKDDDQLFLESQQTNATEKSKSLGPIERFRAFYHAPYVRFWTDALAFATLLVLFSYMILRPFEDEISNLEWVILLWFVSLGAEEFRQFAESPREWKSDLWNWADACIVAVYMGGFLVRVSDPDNVDTTIRAKAIFAFTNIVLWVRSARYYTVSEVLGPKLIMMNRMARDVATFFALLALFLLGYGIAAQALLFPDREFGYQTIENIFFRPYFQIYGELFLDEIEDDTDCVGPWQFSSCGIGKGGKAGYLVPLILAFYLLVVNILLVNLLIAMFNQTYMTVEEQSRRYWNMQNFELYQEYKTRPLLPPPFILISLFVRLVRDLYGMCAGRQKWLEFRYMFQKRTHSMAPAVRRRLEVFQEINTDKYISKALQDKRSSDSAVIKSNSDMLGTLLGAIYKLEDQQLFLRNMVERQGIAMRQLNDATNRRAGLETQSSKGSLMEVHIRWKPELVYPGCNVQRFPVDLNMMSWEQPYPEYNPVEYTHRSVIGAVWADPEDHRLITDKLNTVSGGIDRRSFVGEIKTDSTGRPLNPMGRTGMTGRGLLGKWGANHAADPIVTRWKRNEHGSIIEREGRKVLEFVCVQRRDDGSWALPGGFVDAGQSVSEALRSEFKEEALSILETNSEHGYKPTPEDKQKAEEVIDDLFSNGVLITQTYSNDNRNTDNAWIETTAMNFHDETGLGVGKLRLHGGDDAVKARWMMVHKDLKLFASHRDFMRAVAARHNAYW
eukprot:m.185860 g.185860  ORF g.185860 m.185860 type:complete len:1506 (-) comp10522_c1_seq1:295-4812(-)